MRRNCLILTVLIVASACLLQIGCKEHAVATRESEPELTASEPITGSAEAETSSQLDKSGPEITFEKVVHDFGDIAPGSTNVCEFKFTNTGDSLLKITKVSKTCGCTPYTLSKKEYEPDESGTLKVRYNASKRSGSIRKHLFVSSNDKAKPRVELTIKGKIIARIDYQPKKLNLSLNEENAGCPAITIKSLDDRSFSIKGFKSTGSVITADFDSSARAKKFVVQPKVDVEKLQKGPNGHITINLAHPEIDVVTIPFRTPSRFKITPPSLIVYKAEAEKPVTKDVWILSNYDEDFEVESTSTQKGTIKVLSQEKKDNRYKFELEITPPATKKGQGRFFTDVFLVNIKGGERLKVACRVFYSEKK